MKPDRAISLEVPLTSESLIGLKAGGRVELSGVVYTARDQAHRRMVQALRAGQALPFDPAGQVVYYAGPAPAPPGRPIGSIGPTTSSRMDGFTVPLLNAGLKGMIGKGARSEQVRQAIIDYRAVYFAAVGGAAALLAGHVKEAELIAYEDLGPEAVYRLIVEGLPLVVALDAEGRDFYEESREAWRSTGEGSSDAGPSVDKGG